MSADKYLYRVRQSRDVGRGFGSHVPLEYLRRDMLRSFEKAIEEKAVMTVPRQGADAFMRDAEVFEMELFILTPAEMRSLMGR